MPSTRRSLHVVGGGLIGGSAALSAARAGWRVTVEDVDAAVAASVQERVAAMHVRAEGDPGEGPPGEPAVVLVAVPPEQVAHQVVSALGRHVHATVTDVCSVKARPLHDVESLGGDLTRFVPGHPIAGSEGSGASAAREDLFEGRTWVLCTGASRSRQEVVAGLVRDVGATPVELTVDEHDAALALTSHLPQVLASALAAVVGDGVPVEGGPLDLSDVVGPALLDMTRVASSPPALWATIAATNAPNLAGAVRALREVLEPYERDLDDPARAGSATAALVEHGAAARRRIAAKHQGGGAGAASGRRPVDAPRLGAFGDDDGWAWVEVAVPDAPGALAGLFATAARLDVNIEDVHVDHAPHRAAGLVRLAVRAADADALRAALDTAHR